MAADVPLRVDVSVTAADSVVVSVVSDGRSATVVVEVVVTAFVEVADRSPNRCTSANRASTHEAFVALLDSVTWRLAMPSGALSCVTSPRRATHRTLPPHLTSHSVAPTDPTTEAPTPLLLLNAMAMA